jgi:hypothetical protein
MTEPLTAIGDPAPARSSSTSGRSRTTVGRDVADALDLHRNVARSRLERLAEAGLLLVTYERRTGREAPRRTPRITRRRPSSARRVSPAIRAARRGTDRALPARGAPRGSRRRGVRARARRDALRPERDLAGAAEVRAFLGRPATRPGSSRSPPGGRLHADCPLRLSTPRERSRDRPRLGRPRRASSRRARTVRRVPHRRLPRRARLCEIRLHSSRPGNRRRLTLFAVVEPRGSGVARRRRTRRAGRGSQTSARTSRGGGPASPRSRSPSASAGSSRASPTSRAGRTSSSGRATASSASRSSRSATSASARSSARSPAATSRA